MVVLYDTSYIVDIFACTSIPVSIVPVRLYFIFSMLFQRTYIVHRLSDDLSRHSRDPQQQ